MGLFAFVVLVNSTILAIGQTSMDASDPHKNDPTYQNLKQIIDAQQVCLQREAQSRKLNMLDLDAAVNSVLVSCSVEVDRYKRRMSMQFDRDPSEFPSWWAKKEAGVAIYIREVIALVRLQH